jgi:hypothetical protein
MMEPEVKEIATKPTAADDSDWDERTLCSDESCIGVIGPDGRCKECGQPFAGTPAGVAAPPSAPPAVVIAAVPPSPPAEPPDADEPWERRRLCSDESCIGVIGPDGRCKECGQPFAG